MAALGATSAAFYESLHAHFDLVFNDVIDRDAGFYKVIYGNPNVGWGRLTFITTCTSRVSPVAPTPQWCCGSFRSATRR
jgi:hypothetical protein